MLAPALRRHRGNGAFHDFQQGLLHTLARYIPGNRGIVRFAADLVDLINIDDAALRPLDIVVRRLQQLEDDVLDILAHIARLGQRGRIGHGERHVQNPRQGLRQQRLARTGRAEQQNVRLGDLDVIVLLGVGQTLVVVVHRNAQNLLCLVLADHVVIEHLADLARRRDAVAGLDQVRPVVLANDIHAQFDAFIADEYGRSRDQLDHFMLRLAAERAI